MLYITYVSLDGTKLLFICTFILSICIFTPNINIYISQYIDYYLLCIHNISWNSYKNDRTKTHKNIYTTARKFVSFSFFPRKQHLFHAIIQNLLVYINMNINMYCSWELSKCRMNQQQPTRWKPTIQELYYIIEKVTHIYYTEHDIIYTYIYIYSIQIWIDMYGNIEHYIHTCKHWLALYIPEMAHFHGNR